MTTLDKFLEDINTALIMQAEVPVSDREQWLIIHCFGYGMTVKETVANLLHNREHEKS